MLSIKICGLTDANNIRQIIQLKPDEVGFIFYDGSVRNVLNKNLLNSIRSIPSTIKKVGVFVDMDFNQIKDIISIYKLDMIQLYHEDIGPFQDLRSEIKIIKALNLNEISDIEQTNRYIHQTDFFLFDTKGSKHGGNGTKFNWQLLNHYQGSIPFILSGGIDPDDADKIKEVNLNSFSGIDINSKFEITTGIKNIELIESFKNNLNKYENANNTK